MESVLTYLNNVLNDNEIVVVAVSGGPDSVLLLHLLEKTVQTKGIKLICAHVNHNKRVESKEEAEYLKKYCSRNNIIFETYLIKQYNDKINFHDFARKERYTFFEEILKKYNSNKLFTAHHGDDLLETILMRMIRGSNLNGYAGFKKVSDFIDYSVYRPLIEVSKEQILEYCDSNNLVYFIDNSNLKNEYTRNRIRNNIIPLLKKENEQIIKHFLEFNEEIDKVTKYIDSVVDSNYNQIVIENKINIDKIKQADHFLVEKIIEKYLLINYNNEIIKISKAHKDIISRLIFSTNTTGQVDLPSNMLFVKEYNYAYIKEEKTHNYDFEIDTNISLSNGKTIIIVDSINEDDNNICRLDFADITKPLRIRNTKPGDVILVKGMSGSKKISDIFINEKIPVNDRKNIPILVDSNDQILWIPGIKKSKFNKSKNDTCDIILKYQ